MDSDLDKLERELKARPDDLAIATRLFHARQRANWLYKGRSFDDLMASARTYRQKERLKAIEDLANEGLVIQAALWETYQRGGSRQKNHIVSLLSSFGSRALPMLPYLQEALQADNLFSTRQKLLEAIQEIAPNHDETFKALRTLLTHEQQGLARWAAKNLGDIFGDSKDLEGELLQQLQESYRSGSWEIRLGALEAFGHIGSGASVAVPEMVESLDSDNRLVRLQAIRSLGEIGQEAQPAIEQLTPLLFDEDWELRQLSLTALAQIGSPDNTALEALAKESLHERFDHRFFATRALVHFFPQSPECHDAIRRCLDDEVWGVRRSMIESLGEQPALCLEFTEHIARKLHDKEREIRQVAYTVLQSLDQQELIYHTLIEALNLEDIRGLPRWSMLRLGPLVNSLQGQLRNDGTQTLISLLDHEESAYRSAACDSLNSLVGEAIVGIIPRLLELTKDPIYNTRIRAANSLSAMATDQHCGAALLPIFTDLIDLLESKERDIRRHILEAFCCPFFNDAERLGELISRIRTADGHVNPYIIRAFARIHSSAHGVYQALVKVYEESPEYRLRQLIIDTVATFDDAPYTRLEFLEHAAKEDHDKTVRNHAQMRLRSLHPPSED